jgi:heavy metal sensor kinase
MSRLDALRARLGTLRIRLALWTAGLLFATLVLFGAFVYGNMSRSLGAANDETLQLAAVQLMAEAEVTNRELAAIESPLDDPQYSGLREQGFSMRAFNPAGRVVQEYGPYRALLTAPPIAQYQPDQPGEFITVASPHTHDPIRIYSTPVVQDGRVVGALQVAMSRRAVSDTLNLLRISLLLVGPLLVIAAGSGGYFLAGRALAPVDQITRTAREISAGDLSARLQLPATDDEVGRLAATFDSMLARLDNAFRRERQFTADASHELRTPLAAMQTIIGSTLARQRAGAEYEQALSDLGREVRQMRALTEQLLQMARHDTGPAPASFEPVDLATLLEDIVDSLRPRAEAKGLALVATLPASGLGLIGDGDGLIRLFMNLLDNAIKYTDRGSIGITARPLDGRRIEVVVSDSGLGIRPEHLPHIFERFYRVDGARSKEGTGLGLAIARDIARAHGGTISVESKAGRGTTFRVELAMG